MGHITNNINRPTAVAACTVKPNSGLLACQIVKNAQKSSSKPRLHIENADNPSSHAAPLRDHESPSFSHSEPKGSLHPSASPHIQLKEATLAEHTLQYDALDASFQQEVKTRALQESGMELGFYLPLHRYETEKCQLQEWMEEQVGFAQPCQHGPTH